MKYIDKISRGLTLILLAVALAATPAVELSAQKSKGKSKTTTTATKSSKSKNSKKTSSKTSSKGPSKKGSSKKGSSKPETSADVKKKQEATAREIQQTQQQIKENEAAVKKNLNQLGKLEGDIDVSKKKVANANAKVTALHQQISSLETQIAKDEQSLEKLRAEYLKAVKAMRGKKRGNSNLAFIFSSKSFNEALRRMRYLREFSEWRSKQTAEISGRVESLKKQTAQLQQTKQMYDSELALEVKERNNLQNQYARQDAIVVELKKNGQALQSHLAKKQAEANTLKSRIAALIAEEQRKAEAERVAREKAEAERLAKQEADRKAREEADRKAREEAEKNLIAENNQAKETPKQAPKEEKKKDKKSSGKKKDNKKETATGQDNGNVSYADARKRRPKTTSPSATSGQNAPKQTAPKPAPTPSAPPAGGTFESQRGALPRPVSGHFKVTARFGRQNLPDLPGVSYDNPGIDAEVASGATAQAVYGGKVSGVYMVPGYSTVVIVNHGTYYTVYGNLSAANVKVGDVVKQGQGLGKVAPDEDDPSHSSIHFEVWKNRDKQDPLAWIR